MQRQIGNRNVGTSLLHSARERRNLRNGLFFVSPWLVGFLVLNLYPIIASAYYSLTQYTGVGKPTFVGLQNYKLMFTRDPLFMQSLWNTIYMVIIGMPISLFVGIGVALLLNMKIRGQGFFRTVFFVPSIVPVIGSTILFLWLFNPQYGLINQFLGWFGIHGVGWFSSPLWSKPALIILGLWGVGNAMVIYLANLKEIPSSLYDAASVDGAGVFSQFRHVTLPMLTPSIFFNTVMGFIGTFQYFTQAFVASQGAGGPYNSTMFYALYLFNQAFNYFNLGYASALAWVLFVIVLVITIILFKTSWRWVFYAGEN